MTELSYLDYELRIEKEGDGFRVRVEKSPVGEALSNFDHPFSPFELENFYLRVGRARSGVRRLDSPEMQEAKKVGSKLFEAIFQEEVYGTFRASINQAANEGKGLRLRLRVDSPELNEFPWEYLYNSRQDEFLSLSIETPIVRYIDIPRRFRPVPVTLPLQVLVMVSSPSDYPPLDVEKEWQNLQTALADLEARGAVKLTRADTASLAALQRMLRREEYHIFHFIGHGGFEEATQEGVLLFEDDSGRGRKLSGQYLGAILRDERSLKLTILNACEGARTSKTDPFAGVAQNLVRRGIPAVVGMQFEITDRAAITFSREIYSAIADGFPIDSALAEARKAIFAQGNDIEWGTPVLFTRSSDGRIFDVQKIEGQESPAKPAETAETGPPEMSPEQEEALERIYIEALSAYWVQDWSKSARLLRDLLKQTPAYKDAAQMLTVAEGHLLAEQQYARAQQAVETKDWSEAQSWLQKLVERDPDYQDAAELLELATRNARLQAHYEQARELHTGGRWQAVVGVFRSIHELDPAFPDPEGLLTEAEARLQEEQRQAALEAEYRRALEAMRAKRWEEAQRILERLSEQQADYKDTAALLNRIDQERAAQEAAEKQARLADLIQQADGALAQENWSLAIRRLQEAQALDPESSGAKAMMEQARQGLYLAGLYDEITTLRSQGKYAEALNLLRRMRQIDESYRDITAQIRALEAEMVEEAPPAEAPPPAVRPERQPQPQPKPSPMRRVPIWLWIVGIGGGCLLTALAGFVFCQVSPESCGVSPPPPPITRTITPTSTSLPITATHTPTPTNQLGDSEVPRRDATFTPTPTATRTATPTQAPPALSPSETVALYWSLRGASEFDAAWELLSPGFQARMHGGDLEDYRDGTIYCGIETSDVVSAGQDGKQAYVSAQVDYLSAGSCNEIPYYMMIRLVQNGSQRWQIEQLETLIALDDYFQLQSMALETENLCLESNRVKVNSLLGGASFMASCANTSGQRWRMIPEAGGYFRLQSEWLEPENQCLESSRVEEGAFLGGASFMIECGNASGQFWKMIPRGDGYFLLQSQFLEPENMCLESNRVESGADLGGASHMTPCGDFAGQLWRIKSVP